MKIEEAIKLLKKEPDFSLSYYKRENAIDIVLQEIERLQKEIKEYQEELAKADSITQSCIFEGEEEATMSFRKCLNHLERLHSIIKEVREFVEKRKDTQMFRKNDLKEVQTNIDIVLEQYDDILEILDKENK